MKFNKEDLIKSPLNYTGGKFKLLPQILPLIPNKIDKFIDLFAGGGNVGININANIIVCNDIETHVINLMKYFNDMDSDKLIQLINETINTYGLSDTSKHGYEYYGCDSSHGVGGFNKDKFILLREKYNLDTSNNLLFFTTVLFAFSNQIRFNSKGDFNMPVNKRDFNNNVKKNTIKFVNKLKKINIIFTNNNFNELDISILGTDDLVYCDPPYLVTCASYNEKDGWNETCERELLKLLDNLDKNNIQFALSNVLENKGKKNEILIEWSKKYTIHYLNNTYGNCNYHAKDKSEDSTLEVLITNY